MKHLLMFSISTGLVSSALIYHEDGMPLSSFGHEWAQVTPGQWEYTYAVLIDSHEPLLATEKQRTMPNLSAHEAILLSHGHYQSLRANAYDPIGDQLDRITKALAYLADQGIDISLAGKEQVKMAQDIKEKYPKSRV